MLQGLRANGALGAAQATLLHEWQQEYAEFATRRPLDELFQATKRALADGVLTEEELLDLLWLAENVDAGAKYYDATRSQMQELHGLMAGIVSDGQVTMEELKSLSDWIEDHRDLASLWPFTEVESLVLHVSKDRCIDREEHQMLVEFFGQFGVQERSPNCECGPITLKGVCAVQPQIEFGGKTFCFTGESVRATRAELEKLVCQRGGAFWDRVTKGVDYLIVGSSGSPFWAFSCYGRKVEHAMQLRQRGLPLLIVHELDFWDEIG